MKIVGEIHVALKFPAAYGSVRSVHQVDYL